MKKWGEEKKMSSLHFLSLSFSQSYLSFSIILYTFDSIFFKQYLFLSRSFAITSLESQEHQQQAKHKRKERLTLI